MLSKLECALDSHKFGSYCLIHGMYEDTLVKTSGKPIAHGIPKDAIPMRDEPNIKGAPESPWVYNFIYIHVARNKAHIKHYI